MMTPGRPHDAGEAAAAATAGGGRIEIGMIDIALEAVPGVDPVLFARHVELGLMRLRLDTPGASRAIARLAPAPVQAMPGDTAVTLAARVCAGVSQALATALRTGGGRP